MIRFPNAKINLGLHITGKRHDGFHNLETAFYPVQWCDALEIVSSGKVAAHIDLQMSGADFGDNEKNLCYKAWKLLNDDFHLPSIKMFLHKFIPHGAGLGGGSADGAFALNMLNDLFNLNLKTEDLIRYASKLGSDCAFFIYNTPVIATGRGEIMESISVNLDGYFIGIVKPRINVSTSEAYSNVKPVTPDRLLNAVLQLPVQQWKDTLINDFEKTVFEKHPSIGKIKEQLYISGATYASMSGSGSAVFGIFEKPVELDTIFPDCRVWMTPALKCE